MNNIHETEILYIGFGGFGSAPSVTTASANSTQSTLDASTFGTTNQIGKHHVYPDSRGFAVASITGAIKNQGLEELRIRDYFIMRNNTLPADKKQQIDGIIANNIRLRDSGILILSSSFLISTL